MNIGEYVIIEQNSIICALKIGNNVHIGKNTIVVNYKNNVLGKFYLYKVENTRMRSFK